MSLLTETGGTKDYLRLPTDDTLLTQVSSQIHFASFLKVSVEVRAFLHNALNHIGEQAFMHNALITMP